MNAGASMVVNDALRNTREMALLPTYKVPSTAGTADSTKRPTAWKASASLVVLGRKALLLLFDCL